jgi:hypothetical protein
MPSLREGFFPPKTGKFGRKTTEFTCFWRILSPNGFGQVEVGWRADFENIIIIKCGLLNVGIFTSTHTPSLGREKTLPETIPKRLNSNSC